MTNSLRCLVSPLLLSIALAAQGPTPCQAEFDTPVFLDNTSTGGPNLLIGIKTTANGLLSPTRIEMFTGERTGASSVAIWSHDAVGDRPGMSLSGGTWNMGTINTFQGANLTTPLVLNPGTVFWVVWGMPNGAQSSVEAMGAGLPGRQPYRGSFDGGQTWNGGTGGVPFVSYQWKFRIYCGATPAHYEVYGANCPGSGRTAPVLGFTGAPSLGTTMTIELRSALANTAAVLTLGISDSTWLGLTLPLDLTPAGAPRCMLLASGQFLLVAAVNASGAATQALSVPNDMSLISGTFFDQWWVIDPAANALQLAFSNGGRGIFGN